MDLAIVIDAYHPSGGGAQRSTCQIAGELVARGHKVNLIAGYCPQHVEIPGTKITRFSTGGSRSAWWVLAFSRWATARLTNGNFDASLSVTTTVPAWLIQPRSGTLRETFARNIAMRRHPLRRLSKRLLLKLSAKHQLLLALERRTLANPMVRWIAPGSRYVARQLEHHYGIDPSQIKLVPNAAQMPRVNDELRLKWRQQIRSAMRISDESTVYLFAAFNPRLKGVESLLCATRRLIDRGVDLTVLLAGDMGYAQQHMAAKLRIRDRIRMVGTTDQMAQLYATADVTVHPTFYDPSSKVVIESLMMGTPAISTSFNGASDLILGDDGQLPRGRVIQDPADIAALSSAMTEMADPMLRQQCVAAMNGLADALSIKRHVDRLEPLLADCRA